MLNLGDSILPWREADPHFRKLKRSRCSSSKELPSSFTQSTHQRDSSLFFLVRSGFSCTNWRECRSEAWCNWAYLVGLLFFNPLFLAEARLELNPSCLWTISVISTLYPKNKVMLRSDSIQMLLIDAGFVKICDMVNDTSLKVREKVFLLSPCPPLFLLTPTLNANSDDRHAKPWEGSRGLGTNFWCKLFPSKSCQI